MSAIGFTSKTWVHILFARPRKLPCLDWFQTYTPVSLMGFREARYFMSALSQELLNFAGKLTIKVSLDCQPG